MAPIAQAAAAFDYTPLVEAAARGDRGAMDELLRRAQTVAYRFSLLVCGHPEDAEDVMQEALLKTYQHVGRLTDPQSFRTWLYTTVRNACLSKRRRRAGEPVRVVSIEQGDCPEGIDCPPVDVPDTAGRGPDQQFIDSWANAELRAALQTLPAPQRLVIVMRDVEGLSTREVADVIGITEANVKTRLHRARAALQKALKPLASKV